jgi:dihydrodipicolinate synthase/N-acetylneuraminate lyase
VHGVVNAVLALLHLDFCGAADADDRDAARKLGEPLLELLAVVVRCGFLDLRPDLGNAGLNVGLLAGAALCFGWVEASGR